MDTSNTNTAQDNAQRMHALFGRAVLWIGTECKDWQPADFAHAAQFAKGLGFSAICPKRADGSIRWYGDVARLRAEREAVLSVGIGYIPFGYCYGPHFGDQQVRDECAVLCEMASVGADGNSPGFVQADMEAEWNGQVAAAQLFESIMRPTPYLLSVSTWADPAQQEWIGVIDALAPCVNAWTPQRYTNWLSGQPLPPAVGACVQVGVDLTGEFGPDDPVSIARQSPNTVFVWEYAPAQSQESLARAVVEAAPAAPALPGGGPPPAPPAPPQPPQPPSPPGLPTHYTVRPGDSLWAIAAHFYGDGAKWPVIYAANHGAIGADPDIIRIGLVLEIPALVG